MGGISSAFDSNEASENNLFRALWKSRYQPIGPFRHVLKTWLERLYQSPRVGVFAIRRWRAVANGHEVGPFSLVPWLPVVGPGTLRVGRETAIGRSVSISLHSDVTIGSRVAINEGVKLLTGSYNTSGFEWKASAKPIIIKDYTWIAENAIILPGVTIGRGAVVGAGSVVQSDIPDYSIAFGSPARVYPARRPASLDYNPIQQIPAFEAWLRGER